MNFKVSALWCPAQIESMINLDGDHVSLLENLVLKGFKIKLY